MTFGKAASNDEAPSLEEETVSHGDGVPLVEAHMEARSLSEGEQDSQERYNVYLAATHNICGSV